MWKKIGIGIAVLLVVIAGAGWYLFANLNSYVKSAIEKYGTQATQTPVGVGSVDLSLSSGTGTISNLSVGNPQGFSAGDALSLGAVTLQLDTSTISGTGPIVIRQIKINAPHVTYEVVGGPGGLSLRSLNLKTRSNLDVLQKNAQDYAGGAGQNGGGQSTAPQRKEIIEDFTLSGGQVSVVASLLRGKTLTVPLPTIHLTDIGGQGGATPAQIGAQIMTQITSDAALAGAAALMHVVGSPATGPLGTAVGSKLKSLF